MRALRFTEFGDPGVLHVTDLPDLTGTAHEAVIRVEAASVNPVRREKCCRRDGLDGAAAHARA